MPIKAAVQRAASVFCSWFGEPPLPTVVTRFPCGHFGGYGQCELCGRYNVPLHHCPLCCEPDPLPVQYCDRCDALAAAGW